MAAELKQNDLVLERYRLERPLSVDASTWLVTVGADQAVVKAVPFHLDLWFRIRWEEPVLQGIGTARIPALLQQGREEDWIFRVFEYLPGATLQERLRQGAMPLEEFYACALELLENLQHLHGHGFQHRDLKPGNLVLGPAGLSLIDFGFASVGWGTVLYAAPEATGLLLRDVGPAADLYSAGALLFECVTGQPPFQAHQAGEILRQHLSAPVPRVSRWQHLQAWLEKLLAKEPDARFASAREAHQALRQLQAGDSLTPSSSPARIGLQQSLQTAAQLLQSQNCLVVTAPSGGGKSYFLEQLSRQLGFRSLRAQATTLAEQRPWQLLAWGLHLFLRQCGGSELELIHQACGDWKEDWLRVLACQPLDGYEAQARNRIMLALLALLQAIGSLPQPTLLVLDDAQWADSGSLELLQAWQRGRDRGKLHVVLASRQPEGWESWPHLALAPLTPSESRQLVVSLAGRTPPDLDELVRRAAGNPLALQEAARQGDRFPTEWTEWLRFAALLGRKFRLSSLSALVSQPLHEPLQEARRCGLLWSDADGLHWSFAHDRFRERLLDLPAEQLRALHAQVAHRLQAAELGDEFELAFHLSEAGLHEQARDYARESARKARRAGEFSLAVSYYARALQAGPDPQLQLDHALSLYYAGRHREAQSALLELLAVTEEPLGRAQLLYWLSDMAFSQGRFEEVQGWLGQALVALQAEGYLNPPRWKLLAIFVGRALQFTPPAAPPPGQDPQARLLVECLHLLGHATLHHGDHLLGSCYVMSGMNLAESSVGGACLGFEWAHHATAASHLGPLRAGAPAYLRRGFELMARFGADEMTMCKALARSFVPRFHTDKVSQIIGDIFSLWPRLERSGHLFEWAFCQYVSGHLLLAAGHQRRVAESARSLGQLMHRLENRRCQMLATILWVRSTGLPPEIPIDPTGLDSMATMHWSITRATLFLRQGNPQAGAECLRELALCAPSETITAHTLRAQCLRVWAESLPARARQRSQLHQQARKLAQQAARLAAFAFPLLLAPAQREVGLNHLALGNTRAGLKCLRHSLERSQKFEHRYDAAVTRLELARWEIEQGKPEARADHESALQELHEMEADWHLPRPAHDPLRGVTPARLDRFERLLHWGQSLAGCVSEPEVWENLWRALTDLLRCDECQVLLPELVPEWGPPGPVSRRLADAAIHSGSCCVADEAALDQSLAFRTVRSALACAVLVQGQVARLVHVTHPLVARLFEPEEQQLTEFLCSLAASACTNARLHSRLQESEARLRAIFQAAGIGLALLDGQGQILEHNPTLGANLTGKMLGELLDEPLTLEEHAGLDVRFQGKTCRSSLTRIGSDWLLTLVDASTAQLQELRDFQMEQRRWLEDLHRREVVARVEQLQEQVEECDDELAVQLARKLTATTRSLFYSLRTGSQFDLTTSLNHYLDWFAQNSSVTIQRHLAPLPETDEFLGHSLFRIFQESLNNVQRHAQANHLEVHLHLEGDQICGLIRDDGCGFQGPTPGQGLEGMRFRLQLLGGTLQVQSHPGAGTELRFTAPRTQPQ